MKCRAAVLRGVGMDWEIREVDLDPPRNGEVLVRMAVAGICHSDDHLFTGDVVPTPEVLAASGQPAPDCFPLLGGHEGAGVVEVGVGVDQPVVERGGGCSQLERRPGGVETLDRLVIERAARRD